MILDLEHFIATEKPYWDALEKELDRLERQHVLMSSPEILQEVYYLYQRASSDLVKLSTFAANQELHAYLESLVARAYANINAAGQRPSKFRPLHWFFVTFPQTFRAHYKAFLFSLGVTLAGCCFGVLALSIDEEAKAIIIPFSHLMGNPSDRVAREETRDADRQKHHRASFSGMLATHNTRVSIFVLTMSITWGIGTIITLFYNGVILGAVCLDYMLAGESVFLAGWLLPHGAVEIPAILIAGQAGFVLAQAMIGRKSRKRMKLRLRDKLQPLITLILGVSLLLIWAGLIESYFSQYHEPALPYALKISFGMLELVLLFFWLFLGGRKT